MPDLEEQLTELGNYVAWPESPPRLWRGVRQGRTEGPRVRWALAAAAALLLVVAALLVYAPTRDALAGFLNLHTTVNRVPALQSPSPRPGQSLGLGTPTTLAQAQSQLTWKIALPPAVGQPDAVYLTRPPLGPSGGEVTLVYTNLPGIKPSGQTGVSLLVTEVRGAVNEQFFGKTVGPGTTIESVEVNGHRGWWISGQPHVFGFTAADGNAYFDTLRLATNTLIIDDGGTIVRIEGDVTKAQALQIADTL